jgi:YD repeat-containing protein
MEFWSKIMKNLVKLLALTVFISTQISAVLAASLAPPVQSVVDRFSVDIGSGQINQHLSTVKIGSAMPLSHSISAYTNNFSFNGFRGYKDKYWGQASFEYIGRNLGVNAEFVELYVMRVYDVDGSTDFIAVEGGVYTTGQPTATSTFRALRDPRNTLVVNGNYLVWTKADGTVSKFKLTGAVTSGGYLESITYPNELQITIHLVGSIYSVTTNTGLQLKYNYPVDTRAEDSYVINFQSPYLPLANTYSWSQGNPKTIQAINNAIDYCNPDLRDSCTLTKSWPTATFTWPVSMPRALFLGQRDFTVEDPLGRKTIYTFEGQDLAYTSPGNLAPGMVPNQQFAPRLIKIKESSSTATTQTFAYKNNYATLNFGIYGTYQYLNAQTGIITRTDRINEGASYNVGTLSVSGQGVDPLNQGSPNGYVKEVELRGKIPGSVISVTTLDGKTNFEFSWRNFPISFYPQNNSEPGQSYEYHPDFRGNLTKFTKGTQITEAGFLPTVSCANSKTCNQPIWMKDPKGNQTDYTYHEPSGQVATVTSPANAQGIRAQTRYGYEQKFANYFQDTSGVKKISPTGIWLKTSEKTCTKTATTGDACSGGPADEIVTRYEYNSDNLFLTGMTVTADGTTRRTCYQYDIYGNRISETKPKAGLTSCPN